MLVHNDGENDETKEQNFQKENFFFFFKYMEESLTSAKNVMRVQKSWLQGTYMWIKAGSLW